MNAYPQIRFIFPTSVIIANLLIIGLAAMMPGNYLSQLPFYMHPTFILTTISLIAISIWSVFQWEEVEERDLVLMSVPVPPYFSTVRFSVGEVFNGVSHNEEIETENEEKKEENSETEEENNNEEIPDPDWLFLFI